ncbi:hypothetical protein, partial [Paenibacillus donghaensis]|uniref:hypothetical protein n=1 Tax=Paenibacillus donghaensis TaxID=414771 RepID=UPI001D15E4D3
SERAIAFYSIAECFFQRHCHCAKNAKDVKSPVSRALLSGGLIYYLLPHDHRFRQLYEVFLG